MSVGILLIIGGCLMSTFGIWAMIDSFGESFDVAFRILPFISWSGNVTLFICGLVFAVGGIGLVIYGIWAIKNRTKSGDETTAVLEIKGKGLIVLADAIQSTNGEEIDINLYSESTAINAEYNGQYLGRIADATEIMSFVRRKRIARSFIMKDNMYKQLDGYNYFVYIKIK